jgi:hypothetical protein
MLRCNMTSLKGLQSRPLESLLIAGGVRPQGFSTPNPDTKGVPPL